MFRNYCLVALRNLWKYRGFSAINILGLAMGMACSLLIFLFINEESGYDRFHQNANNIYRIVKDFVNDDGSRIPDATTPGALAPAMKTDFPEVEAVTRIRPNWGRSYIVKHEDRKLLEEKIYGVDSSFFNVFTFPVVQGNARSLFENVNAILISQAAAKRHFGSENPVGKILAVEGLGDLMVTGVLKDVPPNAHFHFDFLVSFHKQPGDARVDNNWNGYNDYTYVRLKPGANPTRFVQKVQALNDRNVAKSFSVFYIQPLTDIHLTSHLKWELEPAGNKQQVYIFTLIAIFIVLIAGINYINLTTAKASVRAKEVGVRKVVGALRESLIAQFLIESIFTCLIAALLAIAVAQLLLPVVAQLTGKSLSLIAHPALLALFLSGALALGVLAGAFPAVYLSSFKPIAVLKGLKLREKGTLSLRKVLVVLQFTISIVLIIGAIVISQQMQYLMGANTGFDTDQVVVVNGAGALSASDRRAYLNEVATMPGVVAASGANGMLPDRFSTSRMRVKGSTSEQQMNFITVGYDFLKVMNIPMKEGRSFSPDFPADTLTNGIPAGPLEQTIGSVVLNETAVNDFGIREPVIGKQLVWATDADTTYYITIVGVAKDFHFTSLRNEIKPFAFVTSPRAQGSFVLKLSGQQVAPTLSKLEATWNRFTAERPFDFTFLDDTFAKLYQTEQRFQRVFISMVVLGIFIACLGLFGLATFAAQQRVKEIGIRKVLGASVTSVVALLSKDLVKLVVIALLVAVPLGWFAMHQWLQDFAYRISIKWWVFAAAGFIAVLIALVTISFQSIKAARANPVKNLRAE